MSGAFSSYQPLYAERGIATFPVNDNKRPLIGKYQKLGRPGSAKLVARFHGAPGLGFMTDARSRAIVLDVDTTDERVLSDALARHGSTPCVVRTASGKFHALYRCNGEFRKIRPFGDLPIDLLGIGGFVVAAPSRCASGSYSFIQGSIDDIDRLPHMQGLDPSMYRPRATAPARTIRGSERVLPGVLEGTRNNELWSYCMQQLAITNADIDAIVAAAIKRNSTFSPPRGHDEVVKVASSAWGATAAGRNWFGRGQVTSSHEEVDELLSVPDALLLLVKLRRHHWGLSQTFMIANALHEQMGWGRQRLAAARAELERRGKVTCVRPANTGTPAVYAWGS
jgi:hypothetical protein